MRSRAAHFCLLILFLPIYDCFATDLRIDFTEEKLENGLHVIYAPLRTAPVVHVRVHYHVGSRDDPPDRRKVSPIISRIVFLGCAPVKNLLPIGASKQIIRVWTAAPELDPIRFVKNGAANVSGATAYLE